MDTNSKKKRVAEICKLRIVCDKSGTDIVKSILKNNNDSNKRDFYGNTPLHYACWIGSYEDVKILLENRANMRAMNNLGDTPVCYACCRGHFRLLKYMISKEIELGIDRTPYILSDVNQLAEDNTVSGLDSLTFQTLNDYIEKERSLPSLLYLACKANRPKIVNILISSSVDINGSHRGSSPLHIAARLDNVEIATLLINNGAITDLRDSDNNTPLLVACDRGNVDVAKVLLDRDTYVTFDDRHLLLVRAARAGYVRVVKFLVKNLSDKSPNFSCGDFMDSTCLPPILLRNKNLELRDERGRTLIHIACCGNYPEIVNFLANKLAALNVRDNIGRTPLEDACYLGFPNIVRILVIKGADKNMLVSNGNIILRRAIFSQNREIIELLINSGINVNKKDTEGYTALHYACAANTYTEIGDETYCGDLETIMSLARKGASVKVRGKDGKTPLDILRERDCEKAIRILGSLSQNDSSCTIS